MAELLGLSWDEVHAFMERAVGGGLERRQAELDPHIGVDEKSFRKRHRHLTLVNDLDRGRALYVAEGRRQQSLDGFWPGLQDGVYQQRSGARPSALRFVMTCCKKECFTTQLAFPAASDVPSPRQSPNWKFRVDSGDAPRISESREGVSSESCQSCPEGIGASGQPGT